MSRMHQSVREYNIYRWAGLLLGELSRIPDEAIGTPDASIPVVPPWSPRRPPVVPPWSQGGRAMKTLRDIMRSGLPVMVQDDANIRHLLVMNEERMLPMVSIRDLMRVDMRDKEEEVQHVREYLYQVPLGRPASRPSAK